MAYVGAVKRLVTVIQDLSSVRSLEEIMTLVRGAAREIAHSDGATFVLRDGKFCFYADEDAISPLWKGQKFPIDSCVSGWAMTHKSAVVIPDIYKDSRIPIEAYKPTFVKSLAMFPVRKESPVAAIGVYWASEHRPDNEQMELLQALADTVSVAMENVNLYASLEKRIEELDRSNHAKDEFLMTVSHELRTPLNSITGWSEILSEGNVEKEEMRKGIETIRRNARTQAHIVDDLLDTSRIMSGSLHLEMELVDIVSLAREAALEVTFEAQKRNIKIDLVVMTPAALVQGDPARLRQVFYNLLMNAIKFSNDRGQVLVKVQRVGPGVQVSVHDQGVGMEASVLEHVFDRFTQADGTTTRQYGGLGLGLSITRFLVEEHGGKVLASSEGPGRGSTFTFMIPLIDLNKGKTADALGEYAHDPEKSVQRLSGVRVLVVDDDDDSRALVDMILRKNGARVEKAASVEEALRLGQLFKFDLVVSDLSMPEEDGFSLAQKIRQGKTSFSREIPLIAVTAFTDRDNEKRALGTGFDEFFGKPFSAPRLVETAQELVSHH